MISTDSRIAGPMVADVTGMDGAVSLPPSAWENGAMQCGECGRYWDFSKYPTPAARCPWEYEHENVITITWADGYGAWHAQIIGTADLVRARRTAIRAIRAQLKARGELGKGYRVLVTDEHDPRTIGYVFAELGGA